MKKKFKLLSVVISIAIAFIAFGAFAACGDGSGDDPALTFTGGTVPTGVVGVAYSHSIATAAANVGTPTITYALYEGSNLPAGLSLSAAGLLSGTPTAVTATPVAFTVVVTAPNFDSVTAVFNISIVAEVLTRNEFFTVYAFIDDFYNSSIEYGDTFRGYENIQRSSGHPHQHSWLPSTGHLYPFFLQGSLASNNAYSRVRWEIYAEEATTARLYLNMGLEEIPYNRVMSSLSGGGNHTITVNGQPAQFGPFTLGGFSGGHIRFATHFIAEIELNAGENQIVFNWATELNTNGWLADVWGQGDSGGPAIDTLILYSTTDLRWGGPGARTFNLSDAGYIWPLA